MSESGGAVPGNGADEGPDDGPDVGPRVRVFLEALDRLPAWRGTCWRGMAAGAEFVRPGQSTGTRGVLACSRSLDVATEGWTTPGLYLRQRGLGALSEFTSARGKFSGTID